MLLLSNRTSEVMELVHGSIEFAIQSTRSKGGLFVCDGHQRRPMFFHSLGNSHKPSAALITRTRAQLPEGGVACATAVIRSSADDSLGMSQPFWPNKRRVCADVSRGRTSHGEGHVSEIR